MLDSRKGNNDRTLVDIVNTRLKAELKKSYNRRSELSKLGDILKLFGIEEIEPGKIRFSKENFKIDEKFYIDGRVLEAFFNLDFRYKNVNIGKKFFSDYNKDNPYRLEVTLEKKDGPDGVLIYGFHKWSIFPFMPENSDIDYNVKEISELPKSALIAFMVANDYDRKAIQMSNNYDEITHIRFGNEFKKPGYGSLVISKYTPNEFVYKGDKKEIISRWGFLIPGLKESFK